MSRWLGVDHGAKRIGLAVAGGPGGVATPLEGIPAEPFDQAVRRIAELAGEYQAAGIVVGWPIHMDGSEGPQGKLARAAARRLAEATGLDVRLWDERLSSFEADQALAGRLTRKKRRARQDAVAAAAILRDFLNADGPRIARRPEDVGEIRGK